MLKIAVLGYGYWGPNIVRNFHNGGNSSVVAICDVAPEARRRAQASYPEIRVTADFTDVLSSTDNDAVAIVTPVWTHYDLARAALQNGKHVFVEKPFVSNAQQAEELIELAAQKHLKIMVDHTFLFTGAVRKIRQLVEDQTLGDLYYYDSTRVNLGLFQHDVNVMWDLAPHDLSIMDYVVGREPEALVATGQIHLNGVEDIAFVTLYFAHNFIAHINVNWLSPVKVRMTLIGGERKMLVWNDLEADEKIRVYDKGVAITGTDGVHRLLVSYRSGDMWAPHLENIEALKAEAAYFAECVCQDKAPINDGLAGLRVVKMLQAADKSIRNRGELVYV